MAIRIHVEQPVIMIWCNEGEKWCAITGMTAKHVDVFERRQFSLLGQNFSWIKQVCDEFEQ